MRNYFIVLFLFLGVALSPFVKADVFINDGFVAGADYYEMNNFGSSKSYLNNTQGEEWTNTNAQPIISDISGHLAANGLIMHSIYSNAATTLGSYSTYSGSFSEFLNEYATKQQVQLLADNSNVISQKYAEFSGIIPTEDPYGFSDYYQTQSANYQNEAMDFEGIANGMHSPFDPTGDLSSLIPIISSIVSILIGLAVLSVLYKVIKIAIIGRSEKIAYENAQEDFAVLQAKGHYKGYDHFDEWNAERVIKKAERAKKRQFEKSSRNISFK